MELTKELKNKKLFLDNLYKEYSKKEQEFLDGIGKKERVLLGNPIKNISELQEFTANGVRYLVRTSLTITRFEQFEKLQVQVGYGVTFKELFQNIRKAYDHLNGNTVKPMDAGVVLYNIMNGVKNNIDDREHPILQLCALFMCTEDEDVTVYDSALTTKKINNWKTEGIEMNDFFSFASALVQGFTPDLGEVSLNISEANKVLKDTVAKGKVKPKEKKR